MPFQDKLKWILKIGESEKRVIKNIIPNEEIKKKTVEFEIKNQKSER